jgi:methionyl-tRNA formyltransferase
MKLRVAFAGTPAFALSPLAALHAAHTLVGVLTQPDRPAGRGRAVTSGPVKSAAIQYGVPVLQPQRLRGDAAALASTLAVLREWRPDVLVVVAYGLILPQEVLELPRYGCLNIHASLLPRWRGAAPIQRAILAGDATTGISIMQMDAGLDTGDVLLEAPLSIGAQVTAGELHDELSRLGAEQVLIALEELAAGKISPRPQSSDGVTHAAKLSRQEARVDWNECARQLDRKIRAFNPWPIAEARLNGEPVQLLRSRVAAGSANSAVGSNANPGTVLGISGDALEVACGKGVLQLLQLRRAGKREVSAREFMNAARNTAGSPLVFG